MYCRFLQRQFRERSLWHSLACETSLLLPLRQKVANICGRIENQEPSHDQRNNSGAHSSLPDCNCPCETARRAIRKYCSCIRYARNRYSCVVQHCGKRIRPSKRKYYDSMGCAALRPGTAVSAARQNRPKIAPRPCALFIFAAKTY